MVKIEKVNQLVIMVKVNPASNRREGLPTQLQLKALNKSIDKGYLKLHKNY